MAELLFRLKGSQFWPTLPFDVEGNPVEADGVTVFNLSEVAIRLKVSHERLTRTHQAAWPGHSCVAAAP